MHASLQTALNGLRSEWAHGTQAAPVPAKGVTFQLTRASGVTSIAAEALAASGAYRITDAIDCERARRLAIDLSYNAAAIGGQPSLLVQVSAAETQPASAADSWFFLCAWDGTVTATALAAATIHADVQATKEPDFGLLLHRSSDLRPPATANAADKIRQRFLLNVEDVRWARILYAEAGVTATPGTVTLAAALSA